MRKVLLFGAGKSSFAFISYFSQNASQNNWELEVVDQQVPDARFPNVAFSILDIFDTEKLHQKVQSADVVVSLLPPSLHPVIAEAAFSQSKHMLTASYVPADFWAKDQEWKSKGLIFLGECGLDPGIDHMSTMALKSKIEASGGEIFSYASYTGGLVDPTSDDNPWHYKISWNPANVVRAGQGLSTFLMDGKPKAVPYQRIFKEVQTFEFEGIGTYEGYPNRDSLKYREVYGLTAAKDFVRGTLRGEGYCAAWDVLVQLGLTDDSQPITLTGNTKRDFLACFWPSSRPLSADELQRWMGCSAHTAGLVAYLGLFLEEPIRLTKGTPAQILQTIIEEKLKLHPHDKDMVLMVHTFKYLVNGKEHSLESQLVVRGESAQKTAMAKTVGLPLALATKMVLNGEIKTKGIQIPTDRQLYEPILQALEGYGVVFEERVDGRRVY